MNKSDWNVSQLLNSFSSFLYFFLKLKYKTNTNLLHVGSQYWIGRFIDSSPVNRNLDSLVQLKNDETIVQVTGEEDGNDELHSFVYNVLK